MGHLAATTGHYGQSPLNTVISFKIVSLVLLSFHEGSVKMFSLTEFIIHEGDSINGTGEEGTGYEDLPWTMCSEAKKAAYRVRHVCSGRGRSSCEKRNESNDQGDLSLGDCGERTAPFCISVACKTLWTEAAERASFLKIIDEIRRISIDEIRRTINNRLSRLSDNQTNHAPCGTART